MQSADIDQALLQVLISRWQKVAMVISKAAERLNPDLDGDLDVVAERLYALVDAGIIEAAGDVENWRHSEVRKPAPK